MAVSIKNLSRGTLSTTSAQVIGPGSGKTWLIKSVILTNRDSSARNIDVKVTGTNPSTAAFAAPPGMAIAPSSTAILDTEITLQNSTANPQETLTLQLTATPTTGVDYVLNGVERDL